MSHELTTDQVYHDIRSILLNADSINVDCFKRADIISVLCHGGYINRDEHTYYDIARTVSAALKKGLDTGLIHKKYDANCYWRNQYCFSMLSVAALQVKPAKKEDPMTSQYCDLAILKSEARALYDNISQLQADFANVKTLKQYSIEELLNEIQSRDESKIIILWQKSA